MAAKRARYLLWSPEHRHAEPYDDFGKVLTAANQHGGHVYEPLAASVAEAVHAGIPASSLSAPVVAGLLAALKKASHELLMNGFHRLAAECELAIAKAEGQVRGG